MNGRLYDPLLRRFLNADENIQDPHNTQVYNKYAYVINNPLSYYDYNGEWFGIDDLIVAAVSFVIGYVSHGLMTGQWGWNAVKAGFQFAVMGWLSYNTAGLASGKVSTAMWNFLGNSAINTAISCVVPPIELNIGDFDFSISPSIAIGKGWGFGANVSATFHAGDFSLSGGFGIMHYGGHAGSGASGWEYRKSAMFIYDDGKTGFSLGSNWWSGSGGMAELNQKTGLIGFHSGDFRLKYENDGGFGIKNLRLGDRGDSHRTAALSVSVGDYSAGFNLFTGKRDLDYERENGMSDARGKFPNNPCTDNFGRIYPRNLVAETGNKYRLGALYFGYRNYRFGVDSEHVRHAIQDKAIHGLIKDGGFETTSWSWNPYSQYKTLNSFTSW